MNQKRARQLRSIAKQLAAHPNTKAPSDTIYRRLKRDYARHRIGFRKAGTAE